MGETRTLSVVEIMRALRRYQFELRDEYRVPLAALAAVCGMSRFTLHRARVRHHERHNPRVAVRSNSNDRTR
jgi:hypothetical protein